MSGADSPKDTAPLRSLIATHITAETLQRVAATFDDNRLILVGTTSVDVGQTWVWNMSLLAKHGKVDLYRKVLHAYADVHARESSESAGLGGCSQSMSHAKVCTLLATTGIAQALLFGPLMLRVVRCLPSGTVLT